MPCADEAAAANIHRVRHLLGRLSWMVPVLVMSAIVLLAAGFYALESRQLRALTAVPEGAILATLVLFVTLLSGVVARWLVGYVREPITERFVAAEQSRQASERAMASKATEVEITQKLQEARSTSDLARTLLSELANHLPLGQGLFCLWDQSEGVLRVAAQFANDQEIFEELTVSQQSLLMQCAKDRAPVRMDHPGRDFFRVHSGLGDAGAAFQ
ncbi:hypothetical protein [Rhabdochromatium marinum]|uniref:hypothetical protein n=1 Tax=Rhabdochromatium marinum TaxID=48729 RepID=UPI001906195A|nr:hypothetical protein [Rhabdochromatium marinum]MBK1650603.1 hypothetical protein [Rhabdochromatium marinum]